MPPQPGKPCIPENKHQKEGNKSIKIEINKLGSQRKKKNM
jgi:hypothetical protein